MTDATISGISPFFIVADVPACEASKSRTSTATVSTSAAFERKPPKKRGRLPGTDHSARPGA
jgi:hypothetical protein